MTGTRPPGGRRPVFARATSLGRVLLVPAALYLAALLVRLWAAGQVAFPATEGSAYYVGVARNLVEGRGLVSDAVWSYATPPLVPPRPAFDLWMPMASFVAALPMALLGPTLGAAQLGTAVLGSLVAPLAWWVAREAGEIQALPPQRIAVLAAGSGLTAAVLAPFVVPIMAPDSTTAFTVFAVAACCLVPRVLRSAGVPVAPPSREEGRSMLPAVALGVLLGLAYLSRQEALYVGLAYAALLLVAARGAAPAPRRAVVRALAPVLIGGLVVVAPWLARNALTFDASTFGQALENALFLRSEDVYAYLDRPTLARFLAQGPFAIASAQGTALARNLAEVVVAAAAPAGLVGLAGLLVLRRAPLLRTPSAFLALLLSGVLTYLATALLFPVASAWGTFLHSAGPLVVALLVLTLATADRLVAALGNLRRWSRPNAWLAPLALLAVAVPLTLLQVRLLAAQTAGTAERFRAVARGLDSGPLGATAAGEVVSSALDGGRATLEPLISDRPVWLAEVLRRPVLVLPRERAAAVLELARRFDARRVVLFEAEPPGCLRHLFSIASAAPPVRVFAPELGCRR